MISLIALDIDDTLLAPDGSLPEQNRTVLGRLHRAGVAIVFSSGRADVSIRAVAAAIVEPDDRDYLISFNGARVVTADSRAVVYERLLAKQAVGRIVAWARERGLYLQAYAGDEFLVESATPATEAYARSTGMAFREVGPRGIAAVGCPKLLLVGDHDLLERHRQALLELGDASRPRFDAVFSKPHYLEIVRRGVDKGAALVALAARLGIPVERTMAIGDSANDAGMVRAAGVGVAVANAREELKAVADVVLDSSASDGIMAEVERRFFR